MVEFALGTYDMGEGPEAVGGVGVVGAEAGLADGQSLLVQLLGLRIVGPLEQVRPGSVQQPGRLSDRKSVV